MTSSISEFATILRNGKSIRQSTDASGIPITRIETISNGTIDSSRVGYANLTLPECEGWLLQEGDILISHINSTKHLGKCAIYQREPRLLVHGMNLLALRVDRKKALPQFVYRMLSNSAFRLQIPRITKNSVNQSSFNISNFKKLRIPLPPLDEQRRIAKILDATDALRTKRREAIAELDELVQSVFLDMFGDPVQNPKGWQVVSGRSAFSELAYGTSSKAHERQEPGSIPILRIPNILGGKVDWTHLKYAVLSERESEKLILKTDDLLLVRSNGNPDYIARCARFKSGKSAAFASYLIRCRIDPRIELSSEFMTALIEFSTFRHRIRREARTTAGNYNLSIKGIQNFKFIKPPLDLQSRFAKIVETIEKQKAQHQKHLDELDHLFQSLQHRAFQGEL